MNDLWKAALTGVVEGVTEFLPVSSTGHLIVVSDLINFQVTDAYEVVIQGAAILAVVWHFRRELLGHVRNLRVYLERFGVGGLSPAQLKARADGGEITASAVLFLGVILAFLPFAVAGFLLGDVIEARLFNPLVVAVALIVGGVLMLLVERYKPAVVTPRLEGLGVRQAVLVGAIQLLSLVPGMSRAAATIMGGMVAGLSRPAATEFSFYLSIPTIVGATAYSLVKHREAVLNEDLAVMLVGSVVSFLVAWGSIAWLLRYVARYSFVPFAWYRIVFGGLLLWYFLR